MVILGSTGFANRMLPSWGSRSWRICTGVFAVLILAYGTWTTISDYFGGYVFWWYNLSFALFGFTILGLVLLVREGIMALRNAEAFGLRPKRDKYVEATAPEDGDFEALSLGDTEADAE